MDITGSVFLPPAPRCKRISASMNIPAASIATVVRRGTGRAVCRAFIAGDERPTAYPTKCSPTTASSSPGDSASPARPRFCSSGSAARNGIRQLLTKLYSPTTTGKVERWHQTLQDEFLDEPGRSPRSRKPRSRSTDGERNTTTAGHTSPGHGMSCGQVPASSDHLQRMLSALWAPADLEPVPALAAAGQDARSSSALKHLAS